MLPEALKAPPNLNLLFSATVLLVGLGASRKRLPITITASCLTVLLMLRLFDSTVTRIEKEISCMNIFDVSRSTLSRLACAV